MSSGFGERAEDVHSSLSKGKGITIGISGVVGYLYMGENFLHFLYFLVGVMVSSHKEDQ